MIEVTFKFPDEFDLALYYLNEQFKRFLRDNIVLPEHELTLSETEITIIMWYPDDGFGSKGDDGGDDGDDGGDDDPIWPVLEPEPPLTFSITGYLPEFTSVSE